MHAPRVGMGLREAKRRQMFQGVESARLLGGHVAWPEETAGPGASSAPGGSGGAGAAEPGLLGGIASAFSAPQLCRAKVLSDLEPLDQRTRPNLHTGGSQAACARASLPRALSS